MIVDEVRLPEHLEQGARIGPSFNTSIVSLANGSEHANQNWLDELLEIDASYGIMDQTNPDDAEDSYAAIVAFFRARRGRARGFLFRDASDYQATAEQIYASPTVANRWQLAKTYETYVRRITRPEISTIQLYRNNALIPSANWQYVGKGLIQFLNGQATDNVFATFEFDVPVRFAIDKLQVQLTHIRAGQVPNIMLIQVRE